MFELGLHDVDFLQEVGTGTGLDAGGGGGGGADADAISDAG